MDDVLVIMLAVMGFSLVVVTPGLAAHTANAPAVSEANSVPAATASEPLETVSGRQ
jgi:hypothetical protein